MDGEMSSVNSRSLRFDEVEVRVQTPNSVRDDILSSRQDLSCLRPESEPVDTPAPAGKARNFDPSNRILKEFGDKYERGDIAQRSSSAWSSGRGRRNSDLQAQARQHNQQIADLRSKIESLEEAAKEHAEEKEEMAGTINQLHSVLDQKVASTINEPLQRMVKDLERKLADEKKAKADAVAAVEQKYQGIMEEQEAEIGQLQAELDEYANYMPVDNSARTSRIFEDDRDSWVDDKKDISQFFDDTIDNIFTEIRGNAEHDDITEAAEEAETSLRHLAHEAGLGDDLNKASLAAFGIRQLREENTMLKEMYAEREDKVKELSASQNDMLNKIDDLKSNLDELQGDNADLHTEIDQLEETVENLHQEIKHLQTQLTKKTKELETALNKNDQLVGLEKQISVLKNEITNHHNSYALSQQDLARQRQATAAADARAKESSEALSNLRAELQSSIDNASNLQSEVEAYKSRNTELLRTVESAEKLHKERLSTLSQDLEDLRKARDTLTKELAAAKAADTLTASLSAKVRSLESEITVTATTISTLRTEKTTLEANFQKAEAEAKAAKSRCNVLLHESTEKETIWNKIKMELQGALQEKTRLLHIAAEPYHNALARIASEVDEVAQDREGDLELFQKIAEILEGEEVAEVDTVANILVGIKAMDETIEDLEQRRKEVEEKNRRLKSAIQKWAGEHQKERQGMEKLRRENKELVLRLKAEKKQSDEKIGQLILALRR
jgi:chromosome segregation ATPase